MMRCRPSRRCAGKLESIFQAIDDVGDGMITQSRLSEIMSNPKARLMAINTCMHACNACWLSYTFMHVNICIYI